MGTKKTIPKSRIADRRAAGQPGEPYMDQPMKEAQARSDKPAPDLPTAGDAARMPGPVPA